MTPQVQRMCEIFAASLVLAWRIIARSPSEVWKDWAAVLAILWLVVVLVPNRRMAVASAVTVALYLSVLYAWGQYPHTLYTLGITP